MANGYVPKGYFTFRAEGAATDPNTDNLHWPKGASGVTIGPGYDLKEKDAGKVYIDMISIGVSREDAEIIKKGVAKTGSDAEKFVNENKSKIKNLTKEQKIRLFQKIWTRQYLTQAERVYNKLPKKIFEKDISFLKKPDSKVSWDKVKWEDLDNEILDMIVDLSYQGAYSYKRRDIQYVSTKNDRSLLAEAIKHDSELLRMDKGRRRIPFLQGKENGPTGF